MEIRIMETGVRYMLAYTHQNKMQIQVCPYDIKWNGTATRIVCSRLNGAGSTHGMLQPGEYCQVPRAQQLQLGAKYAEAVVESEVPSNLYKTVV